SPKEAGPNKAHVLNCIDDEARVELGKSTSIAGEAAYMALDKVVKDLQEGLIDILVTAPINKDNIQSENFKFPGHTEFLAQRFNSDNYLMLMVSEIMKVGIVTTHLPLSKVAESITREGILSKIRIISQSLQQDFAITRPRI